MATLNPQILLAQQQFKPPDFNMGETLTNIAKMKAYQQAQRLEELKYGQAERAYARDEDFQRLASQLFTPDTPAAQPPPRGLVGGSPPVAGGPPPPAPGGLSAPGPGPWASGYQMPGVPPPSLATAQPGMPPAAPEMPMGGTQMPGMPPDAQGPPPPPEPPRGLAAATPAPPAPPEPPGGLGGAQPGEPKPLLPQMNERVMAQMYAQDPVKAAQVIGGQLDLQKKKLDTTEKMNELIYMGLTALQSSPNPAEYYPIMLADLREQGVKIPASFPKEYQAGLMAFKLREHETLKNQIDKAKVDVEKNTALWKEQQALTEKSQAKLYEAQTGKATAEAGAVPAETKLKEAQTGKALAETAETQQKTADLVNNRKKELGQVTEYTKDSTWNVYLAQAMKEAGLPPGTSPNDHPDVIAKARQYQTEDKQKVARDTGLSAAERNQGPAATKRLEASNAKGSSAEAVMNVLDEVDRLIDEGVYENVPEDSTKMAAFWLGFRPDDAKAARTKRLYELGNQLTVGMAPNGSLGAGMSEGDRQTFERAGGDLQKNQAALSRKETIKSMRSLGKINMHDANTVWETHDKSGKFPRFGSAREERLKILTPAVLKEAYEAKKAAGWTEEQVRQGLLGAGYREE